MRIENWCGHDIRFVEVNGEWMAIFKDICDALDVNESYCSREVLDERVINKVKIGNEWHRVINEIGIYKIMFESNCIDARKFRYWSATVMQKLRSKVGLEPYEVMRMTDKDIQDDIDRILDTLYYDDKKKIVMQSITVQGGDVEQIQFV